MVQALLSKKKFRNLPLYIPYKFLAVPSMHKNGGEKEAENSEKKKSNRNLPWRVNSGLRRRSKNRGERKIF